MGEGISEHMVGGGGAEARKRRRKGLLGRRYRGNTAGAIGIALLRVKRGYEIGIFDWRDSQRPHSTQAAAVLRAQ